jgi:hypothetical protein
MVARCTAVRTATRTACSDLLCLCCRARVAGDCAADCPERPAAHEERSGQAPAPRLGVWGAMRSLLGPRIPARRSGRLRCKLGEGMCSALARPFVYAVQHCDVMQRDVYVQIHVHMWDKHFWTWNLFHCSSLRQNPRISFRLVWWYRELRDAPICCPTTPTVCQLLSTDHESGAVHGSASGSNVRY